jgi:hypothetical protein
MYRYVNKHQETNKLISFTIDGLNNTKRRLYGYASEKLSEKFIANLEVMKKIADEQPSYKVTHKFNLEEGVKIEEEILFGYDKKDVKYRASLKHRNCSSSYYSKKIEQIN